MTLINGISRSWKTHIKCKFWPDSSSFGIMTSQRRLMFQNSEICPSEKNVWTKVIIVLDFNAGLKLAIREFWLPINFVFSWIALSNFLVKLANHNFLSVFRETIKFLLTLQARHISAAIGSTQCKFKIKKLALPLCEIKASICPRPSNGGFEQRLYKTSSSGKISEGQQTTYISRRTVYF